jgi:hypothetical protein
MNRIPGSHDDDDPRKRIELMKVRHELIDYIETCSSFERHRQYQDAVPWVPVPTEVIEMWSDSFDESLLGEYGSLVFSAQERAAMREFDAAWRTVINELPSPCRS